jgi:transposase InsO family protein
MDGSPLMEASKRQRRVEAVLALFRGVPAAQVATQFGICRSDLYKFRRRALTAIHQALDDRPRGPKRPHNRLDPKTEQQMALLCLRHPTWSSYQVHAHLGVEASPPRTIQRVRRRLALPRLNKRAAPRSQAKKFSVQEKERASEAIETASHLGPQRLAWDLCNRDHLQISPSTIKRMKRARQNAMYPPAPPPAWRFYERHHAHSLWHGDCLEKITLTDLDETAYQLTLLDDYSRGYVFCDLFLSPDQRTTIRALIAAMRQWQVIPNLVIFDNGSIFRGQLLSAFCTNVGFRLTRTALQHPQTNGKLERAFRDDMRDFYQLYDGWFLEPLRRDLPAYVHYRNYVRGHHALRGQPAITRLREQHRMAVPWVLDHLESYAVYEVSRRVLPPSGCIRMCNRDVYLDTALAGVEVTFFETLEGLEARVDGQCVGLLRGYRDLRKLPAWEWSRLPSTLYFEPSNGECGSPRIAVAL